MSCNYCGSTKFVHQYKDKGIFCGKHLHHLQRYGRVLEKTRRNFNDIVDYDKYVELILTNGKGTETARTKIDKEDLEKVKVCRWSYKKAKRNLFYVKNSRFGKIHQVILGTKKGLVVDHINHDTLDNRKQNLRFVTVKQNNWNLSKGGVYFIKKNNKWLVQMCKDYKQINYGVYNTRKEAVAVRNESAKELYGEFAGTMI